MGKSYKPITSMKEVPEQLRKLRRQYLRYQQAEIIYSISHKKLFELASDAGAIYRIDGTVLINRDIFDAYPVSAAGHAGNIVHRNVLRREHLLLSGRSTVCIVETVMKIVR